MLIIPGLIAHKKSGALTGLKCDLAGQARNTYAISVVEFGQYNHHFHALLPSLLLNLQGIIIDTID